MCDLSLALEHRKCIVELTDSHGGRCYFPIHHLLGHRKFI